MGYYKDLLAYKKAYELAMEIFVVSLGCSCKFRNLISGQKKC
jgi:hypothetical protein